MDSRTLQLVLKLQDQASAELRKVSGELGRAEKSATGASSGFIGMAKSIAGVAAAYQLVRKAYESVGLGITVAADMQTAEIGLKTLLGSAEEASATIARLKVESARTPFELPGLTQATQLLTSVTKDGDKSIDIILDIGEGLAAMGKGQGELDRIIVNLQQIAATGKAATIDIKQFAFAGIPIYEMLAETTGKTGDEVAKMVENGEISFELLTEMFDKANDAGGRFHNAFVNQAGSFNQAASNMKDSFGIMMADIVTSSGLFQGITDSMMQAAAVMSNWRGVIAEVRDNMSNFFTILDERTLLVTHLKATFESISTMFTTMLKPAIDEFMVAIQPMLPFFSELKDLMAAGLVAALHTLIAAFHIIAMVVAATLTGLINLATFIAGTVMFVVNSLKNGIELVAAVMSGDWGGAIEAVKNQIADLITWVGDLIDMFENAIDLAKEIGGGAIDFISKVIPGRAVGGGVAKNRPYMVGERGPELFVPQGNGNIVPNHAMAAGGLGGLTINVYGDVTGEEVVRKVSEAIIREVKDRVRL